MIEWKPLRWQIFNAQRDITRGDYWLVRICWLMFSVFIGGMIAGVTGDVLNNPLIGWLTYSLFMLLAVVGPELGRLHPLGKFKYVEYNYYGELRANKHTKLAQDYLALDKADRREFPRNYLSILANPLLDAGQVADLERQQALTIKEINRRNEARRVVTPEERVDIEAALQFMEDQRHSLVEERKMYQELR